MYYYLVRSYWELLWLIPIYRKLGGELIDPYDDPSLSLIAQKLGFKTTKATNPTGTLIICWQDKAKDQVVKTFRQYGGKIVVTQHAWDTEAGIISQDEYLNDFDLYCVGGQEDYDMMLTKYPKEKIKMTGIPRLDVLYRIKKGGTKPLLNYPYYYVNAPHGVAHTEKTYNYYYTKLPKELDSIAVFKTHPGVIASEKPWDTLDGNLFFYDQYNETSNYLLMKYAKAIVTPPSFLITEASLLEVPVIVKGKVKILDNPISRYAKIGNTVKNYSYQEAQKDVFQRYLFDGKCSERVANEIKLLNK